MITLYLKTITTLQRWLLIFAMIKWIEMFSKVSSFWSTYLNKWTVILKWNIVLYLLNWHTPNSLVGILSEDLMVADLFKNYWIVLKKLKIQCIWFFWWKFLEQKSSANKTNFNINYLYGFIFKYKRKLWCLFLGPYGKYDADKINRFIKDYMNVKDQHVLVIGKVIDIKFFKQ